MIELPTTSEDIRAAFTEITDTITKLEANIRVERAKLAAIQSICSHPKPRKWNSNAMGRWPASHFKCDVCGYYKET